MRTPAADPPPARRPRGEDCPSTAPVSRRTTLRLRRFPWRSRAAGTPPRTRPPPESSAPASTFGIPARRSSPAPFVRRSGVGNTGGSSAERDVPDHGVEGVLLLGRDHARIAPRALGGRRRVRPRSRERVAFILGVVEDDVGAGRREAVVGQGPVRYSISTLWPGGSRANAGPGTRRCRSPVDPLDGEPVRNAPGCGSCSAL